MTHVSDALWSCWDQRTILRLERHVPSLKLTASPWKLLERHVPSLKLTASPWKLLIGRPKFKIPNGHRLVFTLGFVLGISMFKTCSPLDWRSSLGQTMYCFSPRRRKMVFKYFLEPVRKSLRNCSSMAIKVGLPTFFELWAESCRIMQTAAWSAWKGTKKRHKNLRHSGGGLMWGH